MNAALRATGLLLLIAAASNLAFGEDRRPRVLILGDRVYQQPARDAAKELKGRVEVVFATIQPGEVRHTQHAISPACAVACFVHQPRSRLSFFAALERFTVGVCRGLR